MSATLAPGAGTRGSLELLDAGGARLAYDAPGTGAASATSTPNGSGAALTVYVKATCISGSFGSFAGQYTLNLAQ